MNKVWRRFPCTRQELNLGLVLTCGQSFRWNKSSENPNVWVGVLNKRLWLLKQLECGDVEYMTLPQQQKQQPQQKQQQQGHLQHQQRESTVVAIEEKNDSNLLELASSSSLLPSTDDEKKNLLIKTETETNNDEFSMKKTQQENIRNTCLADNVSTSNLSDLSTSISSIRDQKDFKIKTETAKEIKPALSVKSEDDDTSPHNGLNTPASTNNKDQKEIKPATSVKNENYSSAYHGNYHSTTPSTINKKDENEEELDFLKSYFQMNVKVTDLYTTWSKNDLFFQELNEPFHGIRILRQDPVENLFSFICSQNNNITRIAQLVEKLCQNYGELVVEFEGKE